MIKVEVIKEFTLKDIDKIYNIKRKSIEVKGKLFVGDTFECDEDMVKYLTGNNKEGATVVKVIEVEPEKTLEERIEDIRNFDIGEPMPKEKFEKLKKEFELKPKKEELGVIPIIGHRKDDVEYVTPLIDKEKLDKLGEEISKYVVVKPTKKKKSSKK